LANRNPRLEVFEHSILRLEQGPVFEGVRDFEYKLFACAVRYQKVLIALARQLARAPVNTKVFGSNLRSRFGIERRCIQGYNREIL
jgi:hypothetical protein